MCWCVDAAAVSIVRRCGCAWGGSAGFCPAHSSGLVAAAGAGIVAGVPLVATAAKAAALLILGLVHAQRAPIHLAAVHGVDDGGRVAGLQLDEAKAPRAP